MVIIAWNDSGSLSNIFDGDVFKKVLSIFITAAILKLAQGSPSMFILAVFIYLSPNILSALLFLFPFIRRYLERSNYGAVKLMMWWSQ
ncbi:callose synthase 3-like, partial [Trifolium medium]|nr:callose synthase 3-like [Trifolium medium]